MIRSAALSALSAAFLAAAPVSAAPPAAKPAPAASPSATVAPATTSKPLIAWADLGIYDVRFSVGTFGTFSDSEFGLGAGAAYNVALLTPDVPLAAFGNIGISFASGGQFFPITGGAAVRYDKLPVQLLGGLGLTLMPNSAGTDTGIGVGILLMGLYPLPQVDPRLSVQGNIQYHLLNHSISLLEFLIGVGYTL